VLDVQQESGAWSLPFALAVPTARVTAIDYPEVMSVTREYAQRLVLQIDTNISRLISVRLTSVRSNNFRVGGQVRRGWMEVGKGL
jgi:hypothetical protein